MAQFRIPFIDASNERSSFAVNVADGQDPLVDLIDLYNAFVPLWIDGEQQAQYITTSPGQGTDAGKPANKLAQRENKFLFSYRDNVTGTLYSVEMPCADLTETSADASTIDLLSGVGLTLAAEWALKVLSPVGNATTLELVKFVGRNL